MAEVHGDKHLEEISVLCSDTNKIERVPASAMFIFIGAMPRTDWLADVVERDDRGFIFTGPDLGRDGGRPKGWALDRTRSSSKPTFPESLPWRCAPWVGEARVFRSRRRLGGGAVHSSVFEQGVA